MHQFAFAFDTSSTSKAPATPIAESPAARLEHFGKEAVSDSELLAVLLQGSSSPADSVSLASRVLAEAGSLANLLTFQPAQLRRIPGVTSLKALQLVAAAELGRRALANPRHATPILNRAEAIAAYMTPITASLEVERFYVLCLNRKNRLLKLVTLTSGTVTAALANVREVLRAAILENACAFVCVHNHPSGDPAPSSADIQITRMIRDGARPCDIEFLDHIIVGNAAHDPRAKGYYSFRDAGLLG